MKSRLLPVLAAVLLGSLSLHGQTAVRPTLPEDLFPQLDQLLAEAAEQSPRMIILNLDREIAAASYIQARAQLLPSLGGSVQRSRTRDDREDQPETLETDKLYYSLIFTQPVFHWGERRNNVRISEISRKMTERNIVEGYRLLAQEIRDTYLQLIVLKSEVASVRLSQAQSEETLRSTEDRLARGVISDADAFIPRITADQARLNTDRTLYNFEEAKRRLALLTGTAMLADDSIPTEIPQLPAESAEVQTLLAGFLSQDEPATVEGLNLKDQLTSAELHYANTRTRLRPKVDFVMGLTQDEQSYTANIAQKYGLQSKYIGLAVRWQLFDGFATRGAKRAALSSMRKVEAAYRQYNEQVAIEAQQNARELGFSERQMRIQERLFDGNRSFLVHQQEQNKLGTVSDANVTAAQVQYNQGLTQTLRARADYLRRLAAFVGLVAQDPAVSHLESVNP